MKYLHYGAGYGKTYEHPLLKEYKKKIQKDFYILEPFESEEDVIETLKLSLENGKTFYHNAKPYMKQNMKEYVEKLKNGVKY